MQLDVIVDESLVTISATGTPSSSESRNSLLALANDFEDGSWRYSRFHDLVWNNLSQTSLSARERESMVEEGFSKLRQAAMNLRLTDSQTDPGKGSEIAEIMLYAVMKHHYKALPVVPKIFYKQNRNDNAKGADSVHIVVANQGDEFSLWLGESKFYNDISDARLDKVVESVSEMLQSEKIRKENSIIVGLSDLEDLIGQTPVLHKIRTALDRDRSIDLLKPLLHIPILLLHECQITAGAVAMTAQYRDSLQAHLRTRAERYFLKQAAKIGAVAGYGDIHFHLIALPVPDKTRIVFDFVKFADLLRGYGK
jgi:hypothetical protein